MAETSKTNPVLVVISVLLPIVGYVLFFTKNDSEPDVAKSYLWTAIAGSLVGLLIAFA